MKKIILASKSPRRHELLTLLKIDHLIIPCQQQEKKINNNNSKKSDKTSSIEKELLEVSYQKVQCVLRTLDDKMKKGSIIIGADTIVLLGDQIIGKPKSNDDAISMLQKILGKSHMVYTGLTVMDLDSNKILTAIEKTKVHMVNWSIDKIRRYVQKENVLDKAGAYAIQGIGAAMIDRIEGCFYNVMGLPIYRLITLLNHLEYNFP